MISMVSLSTSELPNDARDAARSQIVNKREIRVFAMKRSGHHAVIHWLLLHFAGPVYFLNNCGFQVSTELFNFSPTYDRRDRSDPYRESHIMAGTSSVYYQNGEVARKIRHYEPGEVNSCLSSRLLQMAAAERAAADAMEFPAVRDCYLFNIEDFDISKIANVPFEAAARGTSEVVETIIILRDPFNWIASRMKSSFSVSPSVLAAWKSQAMEVLGRTRYLSPRPLMINYNRWHGDATYRRELSRQLGFVPSDRGIQDVSDFGDGSSFDSRSYDGKASEMSVLDRWQHYRDDKSFRTIFEQDPALGGLSKAIFGFDPLGSAREI